MKHLRLLVVLALCPAAAAQIVNGGFSTGSLPPWVVTLTPSGATLASGVAPDDIDGTGPLPVSPAAQFMVGQSAPNTGAQGLSLTQPLALRPGIFYEARYHWSAHALVNVHNASAGRFEIIVDGEVVAVDDAPALPPQGRAYGLLTAQFAVAQNRNYDVGARITRTVLRGEEVFQYIDNFDVVQPCYANCDHSGWPPTLNVMDFVCYQGQFAAGNPWADCDHSWTLNVNDFVCFLGAFAAGCP